MTSSIIVSTEVQTKQTKKQNWLGQSYRYTTRL